MATSTSRSRKPTRITERFTHRIAQRLTDGDRVRRSLPSWGRVHIDRPLPFLCLYRRTPDVPDIGTQRLVTTQASYLTFTSDSAHARELTHLLETVASKMGTQFGAFVALELWAGRGDNGRADTDRDPAPGFTVFIPSDRRFDALADSFGDALGRIKLLGRRAEVTVVRRKRCQRPKMSPVWSDAFRVNPEYVLVGLEVRPIYRDDADGPLYPERLRALRRSLGRALQRVFFDFSNRYTTHRPRNYHMLGKHAMVKAVWDVDRQLGDVADRFDMLLQVTPLNTRGAWNEFKRSRYQRTPGFRYRPLPADPMLLKRQLYAAPLERVEDTAVQLLLRQKLDELGRQITMLADLNTSRFLHGSIQVYGGVDEALHKTARKILQRVPSRSRDNGRQYVDAKEFARRAEKELMWYRKVAPDLGAKVHVRDDVGSGLMVSKGSLLIASHSRFPASRVDALMQHEVGTHVLTYHNGRSQPLRQLSAGLAGYEALQEGLAVMAEYLVGGLSRPRLRLLAARVEAVHALIDGASFVECFRELNSRYGLGKEEAFSVTTRVYRGGGMTKDAVYLRGLIKLMEYLHNNGSLKPLFIGKIATAHVPIIQELIWRRVLRQPPLTPHYLERPEVATRLERVRSFQSPLSLIGEDNQ